MIITGNCLESKNKLQRGGVIPYTIYKNKIYFLLGIDYKTKEFSDFGGGVKYSEQLIDAAFREFHEESCYVLHDVVTKNLLYKSTVATNYHHTDATFFVKISNEKFTSNSLETKFKEYKNSLMQNEENLEMDNIIWIDENNFKSLVFNPTDNRMWQKLKNILKRNLGSWDKLKQSIVLGPELMNIINQIPEEQKKILAGNIISNLNGIFDIPILIS